MNKNKTTKELRTMRLIDADKLVLHLNDYALQEAPFGRNDGKNQKEIYDTIQECMKAVEEQPTAFDVDKVVKQLKDLKAMYWFSIANTGDKKLDVAYENVGNALDKAIEIVKGGGVE